MTAPFEIEEPEPVPWSHLLRVACVRRCGAQTLADPSQLANALCGPCRVQEASSCATIQRLPAETPPPMVWSRSESLGAQIGSGAVKVVPCVGICEHPIPAPAEALAAHADDHEWDVSVRHSTVGGVDWWTVRFGRPGWGGYAVRRGDVWTSVCVTGQTLPPFMALGVTELRQWLADPAACGEAWFAEVRLKVAASELHAKQVRCPGPPRCVVAGPWTVGGVAPAPGEHTHRADGSIVRKVSRKEAQAGL